VDVTIDFQSLANSVVNALISGLEQLLSPLPFSFEQWLLTQIQGILSAQGGINVLTNVPTELTTSAGVVLDLWRTLLLVQLGVTAAVLCLQGYRVTQGKADIWDVVGRAAVMIALGQGVIFWMGLVLNGINAASDGVSQSALDLRTETMPNDLSMGMMLIVGAVLAALAWLKGVVGVVFIGFLLVTAPFVFSLSVLPLFEGLLKWWTNEMTVWTLRPFFVAIVLRMALGLGTTFGGPLQFMLAIVAFWLAWTMDSRIRSFSVGAWGSAAQLGLLSRGVRLAAGAFGGGAGAAAGAAAPATP